MDGCPVCHKPLHGDYAYPKGDWVSHHYYTPKKKWQKTHKGQRNPERKVHVRCEKAYHHKVDHHLCIACPCEFDLICCKREWQG